MTHFSTGHECMKSRWKMRCLITLVIMAAALLGGCWQERGKNDGKHIQVFPGPWVTLDPGTPPENMLTLDVIKEGRGGAVGMGDLVQVHVEYYVKAKEAWYDMGNWWVWVGFVERKDSFFFVESQRLPRSLIGQREGAILEFLENRDPKTSKDYAGVLYHNPVGDFREYGPRKGQAKDAPVFVKLPNTSYSQIEILRVCKGQTRYRTVRLYDDSPRRLWSGGVSYITREPRETWHDEGRIDAVCPDGKLATFEYGPTGTSYKPPLLPRDQQPKRLEIGGYFDDYYYLAWKKLPVGVVLKDKAEDSEPEGSLGRFLSRIIRFFSNEIPQT